SVPSTLGGGSPLPITPPPASSGSTAPGAVESSSSFAWSEKGAPTFTVDRAVIIALQQNPDIRRALQEIERTKGVIIEIRAEALPHIGPNATIDWTDPNLRQSSSFSTFNNPTPPPGGTPFPGVGGVKNLPNDLNYNIKVT